MKALFRLTATLCLAVVLSVTVSPQGRRKVSSSQPQNPPQATQATQPSYKDGDVIQTTICKGLALPEGYVIAGETSENGCDKGAWILKRKGTRLPAPSGDNGGSTVVAGRDVVQYDRFQDVTSVWSPEVLISRHDISPYKPNEIFVRAAFVYHGQQAVKPRAIALVFGLRSSLMEFGGSDDLIILAGGRRFAFDDVRQTSEILETYLTQTFSDEMTERLGVEGLKAFAAIHKQWEIRVWMPSATFMEIVNSSGAEARLPNGQVITLNAGQLSALRGFVERQAGL